MRQVRGGGGRKARPVVTSAIVTAAIAPVLASAGVRAEQVTQLVLGETADVLGRSGEWLQVRTSLDRYEGWTHRGYVREADDAGTDAWRARALAWSEGARVAVDGVPAALPLRARVGLAGERVALPDGRSGQVVGGSIRAAAEVLRASGAEAPERWALERFQSAPYQWGGVTPWGADCSGLVQTTYLARGIVTPRDSSAQAAFGEPIPLDAFEPGDLLFFRSETGGTAITHVAFAAAGGRLVHSTIACGGVVHESFAEGSRAGAALRPRLAAARRFARRQAVA